VITTCPICVTVEKLIELRSNHAPARINENGDIEQQVTFDRLPFAAWFTLTTPEKYAVTRCFCPQCGIVFHHPDLFKPEMHGIG
jgi:hypothetical protein